MLASESYKLESDSIDDSEKSTINSITPETVKVITEMDDMEVITRLGELDVTKKENSKKIYTSPLNKRVFFIII